MYYNNGMNKQNINNLYSYFQISYFQIFKFYLSWVTNRHYDINNVTDKLTTSNSVNKHFKKKSF